jgi:hypothetical protein
MLSTPIRNLELARVQRPLYVAPYVYHYTTVDAFKSIIESQELWLTDYAYLNDSSEVKHGLHIAQEVFGESLSETDSDLRDMLLGMVNLPANEQPRICVSCFSFARDSLTQWKGYGATALGIAFGVEPINFLFGIGNPMETGLAPVIYDDDTKRALLLGFVHDWTLLYQKDRAHSDSKWLEFYPRAPRSYFFELVSTFKDAAFADEKEFRYVYREDPGLFDDEIFMKVRRRFRVSGPLIVPYTTTKDLAVFRLRDRFQPRESILRLKDVIVGPHPHASLAVAGIREFLAAHGYDDVPVAASEVPFR